MCNTDDLDHVFTTQLASYPINLGVIIGVKHDLRLAVAVTHVDKDEFFALFTIAVDPAAQCDGLSSVFTTKLSAGMSSMHSDGIRKNRAEE